MKTFKEYITEIFNTTKPVEGKAVNDKGDPHYRYKFEHGGRSYTARIRNKSDGTAHISFNDSNNSIKKTGKAGTQAVGVLSRMKNIIDAHIQAHPKIKKIRFEAEKNVKDDKENSRSQLYTAITKRFRGRTVDVGKKTVHLIPVRKKKDSQ